jgi:PAS domain S-box-containing protein
MCAGKRPAALVTTALIVAIVANLLYTLWLDRSSLVTGAELHTRNLAHVIEEGVGADLFAASQKLESLAGDFRMSKPSSSRQDRRAHELLIAELRALPFVRALYVLDANGRMMHDSDTFPVSPLDFSNREYFRTHSAEREDRLYISPLLISRSDNVQSINLSRSIRRRDGTLLGVVVAAFQPDHFRRLFGDINVGRMGAVALWLRDGTLLVRTPVKPNAIGRRYEGVMIPEQLPNGANGTFDTVSPVDGEPRIVSYRVVRDYPLVVSVGLGQREVLAAWKRRAWTYSLVSLAFVACIVALGVAVERGFRRRELLSRALRRSEERFSRAFHVSPTAQCISDVGTSQFIDVNERYSEMLGYPRCDLIGRSALELGIWGSGEQRVHLVRELASDGVVRNVDTLLVHGDGNRRTVRISAVLSKLGSDSRPVMIALLEDVTDQRRAEEALRRLSLELESRVIQRTSELEAANRDLEAFAYSVSHDLRAPIRHIDGYARLTKKALSQAEAPAQRYLDKVLDAANRMMGLIDDILRLSRVGRSALNVSDVDLACIVGEVITEFESPERQITWHVDPLPVVQGDAPLLRQVMANLLGNAVKFTAHQTGARIGVLASVVDDGTTRIEVRDNGVGFDPRYSDKLFGVFRRLHRESEFPGTGIGLAMVKRIIERHGGQVSAEGRPGEGARFYFTLPSSSCCQERV